VFNNISNLFGQYNWTSNSITPLTPAPGQAPTNNTGCAFSEDNTFYVFGGDFNGSCTNTLYVYEPSKKNWTLYNPGPQLSPRSGASVFYFYGKIYVHGGMCSGQIFGDTWEFDPKGPTWKHVATGPLVYNAAAVVASNGTLYLFGGVMANGVSKDLHMYDIAATKWSTLITSTTTRPPPREKASMIVRGNRLFLFGGQNGLQYYNDTWQFVLQKDCSSKKMRRLCKEWKLWVLHGV